MFFSRTNRSRSQRNCRIMVTETQPLEDRRMLAGNATVTLTGSHLRIEGDALDNTVEMSVLDGNVVVRGLNNTTINGGTARFIVATGSTMFGGRVTAHLGRGNDAFLFSRNVLISGNAMVSGGAGNDSLGSTGGQFQAGLTLRGNAGDDRIALQDSAIGGLLSVEMHGGNDLVSLEDVTLNGSARMRTSEGTDAVSLNRVTTAAGETLLIRTGTDNDDIAIRNSTMNGSLKIRTRQDDDVVMLDDSTFSGIVHINTGRDDDTVLVRDTNTFNRRFTAHVGDGNSDEVEIHTTNIFRGARRVRKSEGNTADSSTITTRIDNATTGAIGKATAANTFFTQLLAVPAQPLVLNTSANTTTPSVGGALITRNSAFVISGTTTPFSTVTFDTDADGAFDDGTTDADSNGNFTRTITLTRGDLDTTDNVANDQRNGRQVIAVRSTDLNAAVQNTSLTVDLVTGSVVQFVSSAGTFEVELFDSLTPNTVANFMSYFSQYAGSIIHRSVPGFVVQGGGFIVNNGVIDNVNTSAPIQNEFNNTTSNVRGTLSMAQLDGNINSGTSQWFVNLADNGTTLDAVPHTVFGRVIGNGMTVVDAIAALTVANMSAATGIGSLTNVPRRTPFVQLDDPLTGTVSITTGTSTVTGVGTRFTTELTSIEGNPGGSRSRISINGQLYNVRRIDSDTSLVIQQVATQTDTNVQARTDAQFDNDFVRFTSITEILDQV